MAATENRIRGTTQSSTGPQLSHAGGGQKTGTGGEKAGDPHGRQNPEGRGSAQSAADRCHIGGQQLNGGGIEYNQPAEFVGGFVTLLHPSGGGNPHGGGRIAEAQQIGADIGAEIPGQGRIGAAAGKESAEKRPQQLGQPVRQSHGFHEPSNSGPQTDSTGHGNGEGNALPGTLQSGGGKPRSPAENQAYQEHSSPNPAYHHDFIPP